MRQIRKFFLTGVVSVAAVACVTGCSTTAATIDSGEALAKATQTADRTVVFGKFRLLRNDQAVKLGEGVFANRATLHIVRDGTDRKLAGVVGKDGEFAWALEPGDYVVANVGFMNRGEKFVPSADFAFTVTADSNAIYVGTITLESTFESGYFGLNGTIDSYSVEDHCASDCAYRLAQLGLAEEDAVVALFRQTNSLTGMR